MVNLMDFNDKAGRQKESSPKKITLADLSKDSWLDLSARIEELDPWIDPIVDDFVYVRKQQIQLVARLSRELELLPSGGDPFERLDWDAYLKLREKLATKQPVKVEDFERWKEDELFPEPTTVEAFVLGDGTVSTSFNLSKGGGPRINAILQTMAILREAGNCAAFDTYAGMFRSNGIDMLASPGDSDEKVGANFDRVPKNLTGGETNLAPALREAIEKLAEPDTDEEGGSNRFAGMTHFLIIGDGGLEDIEAATKVITMLFRQECAISIDIAVLNKDTNTKMNKLVNAVKDDNPGAAISIVTSDDANDIPGLLADMVKERFFESLQGVQGIPDAVKREKFATVLALLDQPEPAKPDIKKSGLSLKR